MDNLDKYIGNIGNKTQNKDKENRNTTKKTKQKHNKENRNTTKTNKT